MFFNKPKVPKYTKTETKIFHLLKDKFKEYDYYIEVFCSELKNECKIICTKYSYDEDEKQLICFDLMLFIYQTLGSKVINLEGEDFKDGCHTCGHGAQTNVSVIVSDVDFSKIK